MGALTVSTLLEFPASQELRANADVLLAGYLLIAKLHLGQTALAITDATTKAALDGQEATYNTYAAQVLVFGVATVNQAGQVEVLAAPLTFVPTDGVTPNNIWNLWITNNANTVLLFAGQLDTAPVALNSPLNSLELTVRYRPATNTFVVEID